MKCLSFPLFITWNITSNCNLRCKHCFRNEYECDILNNKKINEFIKLFTTNNVNGIILTGGEPLESKHLFYILEKAKGKLRVGIATNGTLLTKENIEKLLKYDVKNFQISLDGASAPINDYIRGKGVFEKVINNIKLLKSYNCNITLAMTVNSFNYNDILNNSLNLANKLNINKLRIEYYIPINKNRYFKSVNYQKMAQLCNDLELNNKSKIVLQLPKFDDKVACGAGIYNCVLNSDLTISPCDLLVHKYKTEKINNVTLFQKFWNEDKAFIEWREKLECLSCKNEFKCLALKEVENE